MDANTTPDNEQPEKSFLEKRREHIQNGRPLPEKKKYYIPKVSVKRQAKLDAEKAALAGQDSFLVRWYKSHMKVMSSTCDECGLAVETRVYQYAINSICHILAKRDAVAPSVKYHPMNFITLCPYHHDILDKSNWKEIELWGAWPIIIERLVMVYPDLAIEERRFFPDSVLKFMEDNKPF
jgi:hypothetical protein